MTTNYPASVDSYTAKRVNDIVEPSHVNDLQDAVVAIQAELGTTPSGAEATVKARLDSMTINVLEYGAKGDGVTDDTAAIQNALDVAHQAAGGAVFLPTGIYAVTTLKVYANTRLTGAGASTSLSATSTSVTAVLTIDSAAVGVVFDHFAINVNAKGSVHGIYLDNTGVGQDSRHRLTNLWIFNAGGDGIYLGPAVIETVVSGCYVLNSRRYGYNFDVAATDNRITNCSAGASYKHGFFVRGNNTHFTDCKAFYSGYDGLVFTDGYNGFSLIPSTGESLRFVQLTACESQNNARDGFHIDGTSSSASCSYITLTACVSDGDNEVGSTGVSFALLNVTNSTMVGCITRTQGSVHVNYGLGLFNSMANTQIADCYLTGNVGPVYTDGSVTGAYRITNSPTYNPVGKLGSPPSIPTSTTAYTNVTGSDCGVLVSGGTVSAIAIGGQSTGLTSGWFPVPVGQTITLTYTVAPTWTWWGD